MNNNHMIQEIVKGVLHLRGVGHLTLLQALAD
jgi:hypothetical protein